MRYGVNQASYREVVIGDGRPRGRPAHTCSPGVIIGQPQFHELRQFLCRAASLHKLPKLAKKLVGAKLIRIVNREMRKKRIDVIALRLL